MKIKKQLSTFTGPPREWFEQEAKRINDETARNYRRALFPGEELKVRYPPVISAETRANWVWLCEHSQIK